MNTDPVSTIIERGVESKYFSVGRTSWDRLDKKEIMCSSLVSYMAFADATGKKKWKDTLMRQFCEILVECQSEEDYKIFEEFIDMLASIGGYAITFKHTTHTLFNESGKQLAQDYLDECEKKQQASNKEVIEFKKKYEHIMERMNNMRDSEFIEEDELTFLIKKLNELQSDLYGLSKAISKKELIEYDEQLESGINYCRNSLEMYQEEDEIWKGL